MFISMLDFVKAGSYVGTSIVLVLLGSGETVGVLNIGENMYCDFFLFVPLPLATMV